MKWRERRRARARARATAGRRQVDAMARRLAHARGSISHHCAGTDTCVFCAEMREAHRREELGIHFIGWGDHARRGISPVGTGDTTRGGW